MAESKKQVCSVGFDLGGTKMLAAVFDEQFQCLGRKRKRTKPQAGEEAGLDRIVKTIDEALEKAKISRSQIAAIGVGCPGPLDLDRGVLLDSPNIGWKDVPVRAALEKEFGCTAAIANDVDSGVFGEYRFGAGRSARCVLGVFPGTGIGGGCVYEGKIFRGKTGSCMEIGHLQVVADGPWCGCGRQGCLEAVASRLAIAGEAAKAVFRGEAPNLAAAAGTDLGNIRSGVLAAAIEAGDAAVEQIVRDAARHIGIAVASVINLLAPETVVLGGGLVEAMPDLFVDTVRQVAKKRVMPSFAESFKVRAAKLGDDATVMGAAAWACEIAGVSVEMSG